EVCPVRRRATGWVMHESLFVKDVQMRQLIGLALLVSLCGLGCGSKSPGALPLYSVSGKLVVNGKPLENVTVQLIPAGDPDTKAKPGVATTDKEGKFVIRTNGDKGANPGKYKVVLGSATQAPTGPMSLEDATKMSGQYAKTGGIPKVDLPYPAEWASA